MKDVNVTNQQWLTALGARTRDAVAGNGSRLGEAACRGGEVKRLYGSATAIDFCPLGSYAVNSHMNISLEGRRVHLLRQ